MKTSHLWLGLGLLLSLGACRVAPSKAPLSQEGTGTVDTPSSSSDTASDSQAVVGPDDAFFVARFLDQIASFTQSAETLELVDVASLPPLPFQSAYDFGANLQDRRLELLAKTLLFLGDKDHDEKLSLPELSALQWSPRTLGSLSETKSLNLGRGSLVSLAGDDGLWDRGEIKFLIRNIAHLLQKSFALSSERDACLREWRLLLKSFDRDTDGQLSWEEQQELRAERAKLLENLELGPGRE